jgi:hypothetical protein
MLNLAELDNLNLDIATAPPEEYVDNSIPFVLPEGTYNFVITDVEPSRNRETKIPDGKAFVLTLQVADGDYEGREVRNMRVWTTTYLRNGVKVSGLGDLIRSIDDTARWSTLADAAAILSKACDQRTLFRSRVVWEAFDADWYEDQGGQNLTPKSPEQKELRKAATVKGMAHFRQTPTGVVLPVAIGPSGNEIEARVAFASFYPSSKRR